MKITENLGSDLVRTSEECRNALLEPGTAPSNMFKDTKSDMLTPTIENNVQKSLTSLSKIYEYLKEDNSIISKLEFSSQLEIKNGEATNIEKDFLKIVAFRETINHYITLHYIFEGVSTQIIEYTKKGGQRISYFIHYNNYDFQIMTNNKIARLCGQKAFLTEHPNLAIINLT